MRKELTAAALIAFIAVTPSNLSAKEYKLNSPNRELTLLLNDDSGEIEYQLKRGKTEVVESSKISLLKSKDVTISDAERSSENVSWHPTWGQFSTIQNSYNQIEFTLNTPQSDSDIKLIARLFDSGVGFRYVANECKECNDYSLYFEFNTPKDDKFYWTAGEREPIGPITRESIKSESKITGPVVVESASGLNLALLESDILSTSGFGVMAYDYDKTSGAIFSQNEVMCLENSTLTTPWRVILVEESVGDLLTNTTPLNLAAECEVEDTSWIKPGKTLWDWRVHGYVAPDGFVYGINTESYKRFIDFAAKNNIDYFLIDDSWYKKATIGNFELSDELDLMEVIRYAKSKEVDLLLYYDRRHGEYGDSELFKYYSQDLGMKGIKYGFMAADVPFTKVAISESAKNKLLIDFHDCPAPVTGAERTYPNAITREYCHAQLDSRRAFTPETFIKMALINALQGPLDMNNGYFDIKKINSGERQKGPLTLNSYFSTVTAEAARTLIINSGLLCLPDAPEAYEKKSDLFAFMQRLPIGKWDETVVLNSKIGEYITTARRSGEEWYIGSVMCQKGGELTIDTRFLEKGKEYKATIYMDAEDTDCNTNPESYKIEECTIVGGDKIIAKIARGGGHAVWIR